MSCTYYRVRWVNCHHFQFSRMRVDFADCALKHDQFGTLWEKELYIRNSFCQKFGNSMLCCLEFAPGNVCSILKCLGVNQRRVQRIRKELDGSNGIMIAPWFRKSDSHRSDKKITTEFFCWGPQTQILCHVCVCSAALCQECTWWQTLWLASVHKQQYTL